VVVSMGEVSLVAAFVAAVSMEGVSVVSVEDVSPVAVSTAVAFAATILVISASLMMSSSAVSAFQGGGAGAIRTDITVTTPTPMITMAMDTAGTLTVTTVDTTDTVTTVALVMGIAMEAERVMDMAMAAEPVTDTALATDQGIPGVRGVGDKPGQGSLKIGTRQRVGPSHVRRQV